MTSHAIFTTFFFFFFSSSNQTKKRKSFFCSYFHNLIEPAKKMNVNSPYNEDKIYTQDELKIVLEIYNTIAKRYREGVIKRTLRTARTRPVDAHCKMIDQLENQLKRKAAKISRAREVLDRIITNPENAESSPSTTSTVSTMNSDEMFTPSIGDDSLTLTLKLPAKKKNKTESNTCSVV